MTALPPLLEIAAGHKVRARKPPVYRPRESKLHCDVAALLRDHLNSDWRYTHINRKAKDRREGAIMKRMGVKRGWGDFELISPRGQAHFIELKRIGEDIEEGSDQDDFRLWCIKRGIPYVVAWTMRDVLAACSQWECLRVRVAGAAG